MKLEDIEYYEYDCGRACTPHGCHGHETNIPIAFDLNGVRFEVQGVSGGDFPHNDYEKNQKVREVIEFLLKVCETD